MKEYYASNPWCKRRNSFVQHEKDLTDDWVEDADGNFVKRG